jgi:UDP-glucuronate 4-epimerase
VKAVDRDDGFDVFNLGESQMHSLDQLVALLAKELGVTPKIEQLPDQAGDVPATCADITKSRRVLGYDPRVALPEGIRRFVQWLRAEPSAGARR